MNRMDAHNLSIVLCPNLVKGSNPVRDVQMCSVTGGPTLFEAQTPSPVNAAALPESKTSLGTVIKLCIQRYYEVFDEVWDRSEAVPPQRSAVTATRDASLPSSSSGSPRMEANKQLSHHEDDEEIDDEMLVMPLGPSPPPLHPSPPRNNVDGLPSSPTPPSAWNLVGASGSSTFKPRHRTTLSNGSEQMARSMYTAGADKNSGTGNSKARSMISIEKGSGVAAGGRKGSISVGRGTTRKTTGAGVEAISITASGFFSAPTEASRLPPPPPTPAS